MSEFDDATALTAHSDGTYSATLSDDWSIGDAVNGGLLMSLAAKAVSDAAADHHPHPLTFSAVFLSPGAPGAATVAPTLLRTGRSMSTAEVVVSQDGTERLRALVTMGDVSAQAEPIRKQTALPSRLVTLGLRDPTAEARPQGPSLLGALPGLRVRPVRRRARLRQGRPRPRQHRPPPCPSPTRRPVPGMTG